MKTNKNIFILVPGFNNDSPIKGAAALANELSKKYTVYIISLKTRSSAIKLRNSKNLTYIDLGNIPWREKLKSYRKIVTENYTTNENISISYCFSADIINSYCTNYARTFSSIRANLYKNFKHSYGVFGFFLAKINFMRLKKINCIISMTKSMAKQVEKETGIKSFIVGNFLDEAVIEEFRRAEPNKGAFKFVFTGTLSTRKRVEVLINAIQILSFEGHKIICDILGDGPMRDSLEKKILHLGISDLVKFHGNIANPFEVVAAADVFVLPSLSEGLSRSSMEAQYLGIPCVLRDIDGNSELIDENINGNLFNDESLLPDLMLKNAIKSRKNNLYKKTLLKDCFRQKNASKEIEQLFNLNNKD